MVCRPQASKADEGQASIASVLAPADPTSPCDVTVVGAGPAGLFLAAELARRGLQVNVLGGATKRGCTGLHLGCGFHTCRARAVLKVPSAPKVALPHPPKRTAIQPILLHMYAHRSGCAHREQLRRVD